MWLRNLGRKAFDTTEAPRLFGDPARRPGQLLAQRRPRFPPQGRQGNEFQASLTATLLKLVKSDCFPIMIVCHGRSQRRWFRRAAMIPGWWFPRDDLDADSFAFEMLFAGAAESPFPRKVGADAWFEFRNAGRYEIQEQSFLLPNNEVLRLLSIAEEGLSD